MESCIFLFDSNLFAVPLVQPSLAFLHLLRLDWLTGSRLLENPSFNNALVSDVGIALNRNAVHGVFAFIGGQNSPHVHILRVVIYRNDHSAFGL